MRPNVIIYSLAIIALAYCIAVSGSGCAQIGIPTGGPKDTLPPKLVKASPELYALNFNSNRITLTFDEYVDIQDVQNNVLVSPFPRINPAIEFKLKTVTVKLKDTLKPNTTYSINFGNAIRDVNEGNPYKNFTYVFSTGNHIDSMIITGKVIIAETGKADSTLMALLYRNTNDSAVKKNRPDYMAKLTGDGRFTFTNLAPGLYKIYALKDGDGSKTYNARTEVFAFADSAVRVSETATPITLYAYAEVKDTRGQTGTLPAKVTPVKKLTYTTPVVSQNQELPDDLELNFNKPLKKFDPSKIRITDTSYNTISPVYIKTDSSRKKVLIAVKWQEDMHYRLIIDPASVADSLGNSLTRTDTIRFSTKRETEYGNVVLRFTNLDLAKNPVLQFIQGDDVKGSYPLSSTTWSKKLFKPGDYEVRILFDSNNNGTWDPGNYTKKIQPEKVMALPQRLSIRANWDNERDIAL